MGKSSILMLLGPKFQDFGCDVGKKFLHRQGGGKIHGIFTGSSLGIKSLQDSLQNESGYFWHLQTEEKKWLTADISIEELSSQLSEMDDKLGAGVAGRLLICDRRIGQGFIRGGLCRPDEIANLVNQAPEINPQKYLIGLYSFLQEVINLTQPDVVFCYAVAGAPALGLAEICRTKKIPFTRLNTSRIKGLNVIDDSATGELNCIAKTYKAALHGTIKLEQEQVKAKELLAEFRKSPEPPEYAKRNQKLLQNDNIWKETGKALLKLIYFPARSLIKKQPYSETKQGLARVWFNTWMIWKKAFLGKKTFAQKPPIDRPFIYFPLHVDPEASTMVLSPWHTDQIGVIEALAKSAPAEMVILVKEHAPMLGKRPRGFYKTISAMPRVILVGPEQNGLSLVAKSSLTAVITGTAAWEAIRLQKPTIVIGNSPFLAIGEGVIHEPCLANLPHAIHKALNMKPASDEALTLYIAACLAESFEMSSSLLWGEYENHSEQERQKAVDYIVNGITRMMKEKSQ